MTNSGKKPGFSLLPKTDEGWMQMQYTIIGIVVSTIMGFSVLVGMKIGWAYGLAACP